ncbi:MAG: hypothetical protein IBJ04_14085 [Hydrogenophaga sp.]|uniref:Uncharacterized protein n=1 Tax=Hydrogenophaga crocea TaxID=2716225 RepID=A0A6G8IIQ5_9BURK|nr:MULTISPECIES: hypothetical protein [Hydrogenophaga]MBL0945456.1 hypothetical protein [Hydrogenophaga sp.]QIM53102.1 hypothetical protein G9Q37_13570 [Hydrogenophaga crocea]
MDNAFDKLVAACERMRHLTGTLETIRNLLMADAMTSSEHTRAAMGDTRETARGLFIHALGLRQRTGGDLEAAVQLIANDADPDTAAQRNEWLALCRELAGSLKGIDEVLGDLQAHWAR